MAIFEAYLGDSPAAFQLTRPSLKATSWGMGVEVDATDTMHAQPAVVSRIQEKRTRPGKE